MISVTRSLEKIENMCPKMSKIGSMGHLGPHYGAMEGPEAQLLMIFVSLWRTLGRTFGDKCLFFLARDVNAISSRGLDSLFDDFVTHWGTFCHDF